MNDQPDHDPNDLERLVAETREALGAGETDEPRVRATVEHLLEARMEEPSPEALRRALAIPRGRASGGLAARAWRVIRAALVPPPAGAPAHRSAAGAGAARLYSAGDFDVDVARDPGGALRGQVLALRPEDDRLQWTCTVAAMPGDGRASVQPAPVDADALGRFVAPAPAGAEVRVILESERAGEPLRIVIERVPRG